MPPEESPHIPATDVDNLVWPTLQDADKDAIYLFSSQFAEAEAAEHRRLPNQAVMLRHTFLLKSV